jgi:tripartite-type tricarboxylate transporter receptor subunit TctC
MQIVLKFAMAAIALAIGPMRRIIAAWLFALLKIAFVMTASSWPGNAESYPARPIKIVVPFPAGGPTDVAARLVAQSLPSRLGQSVVVENLAGAGGRIGAKAVASAQPDGYTVLLGGTNVNAIIGALYKNLGFDPIDSFAPIASICTDSMALAISPHVPAQTFQEFVDFAKSNPGKLKYGAPPGIYTHFAGEFFKVKTGTDILFVPYKGGAPAITDLLGGHIDMVFNNKSTLLTHFKEGKLKALAVTSDVRWPELPDTPTIEGVRGSWVSEGSLVRLARAGRYSGDDRRRSQLCSQRRSQIPRGARQPGQARDGGEDRNGTGFCRVPGGASARLDARRRGDRDQGRVNPFACAPVLVAHHAAKSPGNSKCRSLRRTGLRSEARRCGRGSYG